MKPAISAILATLSLAAIKGHSKKGSNSIENAEDLMMVKETYHLITHRHSLLDLNVDCEPFNESKYTAQFFNEVYIDAGQDTLNFHADKSLNEELMPLAFELYNIMILGSKYSEMNNVNFDPEEIVFTAKTDDSAMLFVELLPMLLHAISYTSHEDKIKNLISRFISEYDDPDFDHEDKFEELRGIMEIGPWHTSDAFNTFIEHTTANTENDIHAQFEEYIQDGFDGDIINSINVELSTEDNVYYNDDYRRLDENILKQNRRALRISHDQILLNNERGYQILSKVSKVVLKPPKSNSKTLQKLRKI